MDAQEIFAEQLATASLYTSEMLCNTAKAAHLTEDSKAYQYRHAHIGEKMVFVMVQREGGIAEPGSIQAFRLVVESLFESEIEDFVCGLSETHDHVGYTIDNIPRFNMKRKDNGPA